MYIRQVNTMFNWIPYYVFVSCICGEDCQTGNVNKHNPLIGSFVKPFIVSVVQMGKAAFSQFNEEPHCQSNQCDS